MAFKSSLINSGGRRTRWPVATSWLRFREYVRAHDFDANVGLVALDPGIVSRRDCVELAGSDGLLGAVRHADSKAP